MTIRVLQVASDLSKNSGVMNFLINYYRNVDKNLIQFDFLYFEDAKDTFEEEIKKLGGKCYRISRPSLRIAFLSELNTFFKRHNDYVAVHIHEVYLTTLFSYFIKSAGIKNIITHSHATQFSDNKAKALRNRIMCLGINAISDVHCACSRAAGELLYGNKREMLVISNAVDCRKFAFDSAMRDEVRKEFSVESDFVIGHVGRFSEQKNHIFLIQIFEEILQIRTDAKLLLVGDGPLRQEIFSLVCEKKLLDHVIFVGHRKDVNRLLQAMDVFLLPSLFEGLPVIGIEAQVSGLRCVVADTITSELKVRDVEFLSLSCSPKEWAKVVVNKGSSEREVASKMMEEAGYNITKEAVKLQDLYLSLK